MHIPFHITDAGEPRNQVGTPASGRIALHCLCEVEAGDTPATRKIRPGNEILWGFVACHSRLSVLIAATTFQRKLANQSLFETASHQQSSLEHGFGQGDAWRAAELVFCWSEGTLSETFWLVIQSLGLQGKSLDCHMLLVRSLAKSAARRITAFSLTLVG